MRFLNYIAIFAIGLTGIALISCNRDDTQDRTAERHELTAVMENGEWKIVDRSNPERTEIEASRGDMVVWYAPQGSDLYFQFMDDRLTGEFTAVANSGESVSLTIGERAKEGENPYAAFVLNDSTYARGESPPRMMIRE